MKTDAERDSAAHSCCGRQHDDQAISVAAAESRQLGKRYFCPMCEGVESDTPGSCARCGMMLERRPAFPEQNKIIYTCPMHPQIQQDHPGNCPICGMTLEPHSRGVGAGDEEEQHEIKSLSRKFWIALVLTIPVLIIAMGHDIPGLKIESFVPRQIG